jgi:Cys-rich four helix bundle protein (predicted Tat secretion target)
MNRRDAILNSAAMALSASLGGLACGARTAVAAGVAAPALPPGDGSVLDSAFDCQRKGAACEEHCVRMLATGDTSMAECFLTVRDMLPATLALARLAGNGSKHVPAAARLVVEVCEPCEAACRKHAATHAVCRDCADACAVTIAACRKLIG